MLQAIDGRVITKIPHQIEFDTWRSNISDADYHNAVEAIEEYIEAKDVFVSNQIPGRYWENTPYQPLYYACGQSEIQAGYFFGLVVWSVVMEDDDESIFKPSGKEAGDTMGTTYWRKTPLQGH